MRLLVLCIHNSARSQMAAGWLRHYTADVGLAADVFSAGIERTISLPQAITVMAEVGIDLRNYASKPLADLHALRETCRQLVKLLQQGETPTEAALQPQVRP